MGPSRKIKGPHAPHGVIVSVRLHHSESKQQQKTEQIHGEPRWQCKSPAVDAAQPVNRRWLPRAPSTSLCIKWCFPPCCLWEVPDSQDLQYKPLFYLKLAVPCQQTIWNCSRASVPQNVWLWPEGVSMQRKQARAKAGNAASVVSSSKLDRSLISGEFTPKRLAGKLVSQ